ncbi:hypothetical protein, partial [Endozoicomonas acroporae]|uniref:hypothetical protein n=1 Tax=Endozoicomonas acroporae TaxID=1701104 RepID=UPI003D7BDA5B
STNSATWASSKMLLNFIALWRKKQGDFLARGFRIYFRKRHMSSTLTNLQAFVFQGQKSENKTTNRQTHTST